MVDRLTLPYKSRSRGTPPIRRRDLYIESFHDQGAHFTRDVIVEV